MKGVNARLRTQRAVLWVLALLALAALGVALGALLRPAPEPVVFALGDTGEQALRGPALWTDIGFGVGVGNGAWSHTLGSSSVVCLWGRAYVVDLAVQVGYETVVPTDAPTAAPTLVPTLLPTAAPTRAPTVAPTAAPAPTSAPSQAPTAAPTPAPTTGPTGSPTPAPTAEPTPEPTAETQEPTQEPTPEPTFEGASLAPVPCASAWYYVRAVQQTGGAGLFQEVAGSRAFASAETQFALSRQFAVSAAPGDVLRFQWMSQCATLLLVPLPLQDNQTALLADGLSASLVIH